MRNVEIYSAGCSLCSDTVERVKELACDDCDVTIRNMNDSDVAEEADNLGIESVPAVVIDGELVSCCENTGVDTTALKAAGLGRSL